MKYSNHHWWEPLVGLESGNAIIPIRKADRLRKANSKALSEWKNFHEVAAFRYELVKRLFPAGSYPDYIDLRSHEAMIFRTRLQQPQPTTALCYIDAELLKRGYISDAGLTRPIPYRWNLNASDNALVKAFLLYINLERKAQGIQNPGRSKSLKGTRNRGVPWKCVSALEFKRGLDDHQIDRKYLSIAKATAKRFKPEFEKAWRQIRHDSKKVHAVGRKHLRALVPWSEFLRI